MRGRKFVPNTPAIARKRDIRWKETFRPLFFVCVLFYLGFHVLNGERGIYALIREERKLESLQQELTITIAQREMAERRLKALSPASLDLDMLDEQARETLGMARPDEVVILTGSGAK